MKKISIPGFPESIADNRFISKQDSTNESINFIESESQLFLLFFEPGDKRPLHKHNELRITFIRNGNARFLIQGKETIAAPGDIVITLPNVEHYLEVIGNKPLNLAELVVPGN